MEVNKIIKKSSQFTNDLENALQKDITQLIEYISDNFEIYDKNTNKKVNSIELDEYIKQTFYKMNDAFCSAITKSGTRCTRKCYNKTSYCKMHINNIYKETKQSYKSEINTLFLLEKKENDIKKSLTKKFINDEFYYIDDKYIYNINDYNKCGYIERENNMDEYIFTDDPFVLDEF